MVSSSCSDFISLAKAGISSSPIKDASTDDLNLFIIFCSLFGVILVGLLRCSFQVSTTYKIHRGQMQYARASSHQSSEPVETRKIHVVDAKRGKACAGESRLDLVLFLIG